MKNKKEFLKGCERCSIRRLHPPHLAWEPAGRALRVIMSNRSSAARDPVITRCAGVRPGAGDGALPIFSPGGVRKMSQRPEAGLSPGTPTQVLMYSVRHYSHGCITRENTRDGDVVVEAALRHAPH